MNTKSPAIAGKAPQSGGLLPVPKGTEKCKVTGYNGEEICALYAKAPALGLPSRLRVSREMDAMQVHEEQGEMSAWSGMFFDEEELYLILNRLSDLAVVEAGETKELRLCDPDNSLNFTVEPSKTAPANYSLEQRGGAS